MNRYGWVEWGGQGPRLAFAHANGFPVASYKPLLDILTQDFQVSGWESRPLNSGNDPKDISAWDPLAEDLERALEERFSDPVIGIGHSLGGILNVMAAAARPDLYKALVLLDPVLFSGTRSVLWGLMKRSRQAHKMPLRVGAIRRRDVWPNREVVRNSWTNKAAFEGWTDDAFEAYIQAGFCDDEASDGVRLRYPKAWEARIFELTPHNLWHDVARLEMPVLVLRGEHSDTFMAQSAAKFRRKARHGVCQVVEGTGHMLPMQKPEAVASLIGEWLLSL